MYFDKCTRDVCHLPCWRVIELEAHQWIVNSRCKANQTIVLQEGDERATLQPGKNLKTTEIKTSRTKKLNYQCTAIVIDR